jgi:hypothetical protein
MFKPSTDFWSNQLLPFRCRNSFFYSVMLCSVLFQPWTPHVHTFTWTSVLEYLPAAAAIFIVAATCNSNLTSRTGDKFWTSEFMWWAVDQVHDSQFNHKTHHKSNNLLGRQETLLLSGTWLLMQTQLWSWHVELPTPLQSSDVWQGPPITVMWV